MVSMQIGAKVYIFIIIVIEREAAELGLLLNHRKSEVICSDMSTRNSILSSFPGASVVEPSEACLLGSPIGDLDCVSSVIDKKVRLLRIMGERFKHLFAHDAIFLLRYSFAIPKLFTPSGHLHVSSLHLVSRVMMINLDPS